MKYILPGKPNPLRRPRFTANRVWDSQKSEKLCTGITIGNIHGDHPFYEPPIAIEFKFYFKMPKKVNNLRGIHQFDEFSHYPDIDNLIKYYLDCCNGLIWLDDRFVTKIFSEKLYDLEARTEMEVWTIKK